MWPAEEEPEDFIIQAVEEPEGESFRPRLVEAIRGNLRRLLAERAASKSEAWPDEDTDEQIGSLAFLTGELELSELAHTLYEFCCLWDDPSNRQREELTTGQVHLLRTLALIQQTEAYAGFWRELWKNGDRSIRGITYYGWVRSARDEALKHLDELIGSKDAIDLPAVLWTLSDPDVLGFPGLGKAVREYAPRQRDIVREALEKVGANATELRDFDLYSTANTPSAEDDRPIAILVYWEKHELANHGWQSGPKWAVCRT